MCGWGGGGGGGRGRGVSVYGVEGDQMGRTPTRTLLKVSNQVDCSASVLGKGIPVGSSPGIHGEFSVVGSCISWTVSPVFFWIEDCAICDWLASRRLVICFCTAQDGLFLLASGQSPPWRCPFS